METNIRKKHQILKGVFQRRLNPLTGPGGALFSYTAIMAILDKESGDLVELDPDQKRNIQLVPRRRDKATPGWVNFEYKLFKEIMEDVPISLTFYLAFSKSQKDVIFSVQFANCEEYYNMSEPIHSDPEPEPDPQHRSQSIDEEYRGISIGHSITESTFHRYLDNFWQEYVVPAPHLIVWQILGPILDELENDEGSLKLTWEDTDFTNNNLTVEIDPTPFSLSYNKRPTAIVNTHYSVKLFLGMNIVMGLGELRFYKGRLDDGSLTILIEAVSNVTGNHGFFDLSNDRP